MCAGSVGVGTGGGGEGEGDGRYVDIFAEVSGMGEGNAARRQRGDASYHALLDVACSRGRTNEAQSSHVGRITAQGASWVTHLFRVKVAVPFEPHDLAEEGLADCCP
jgi:hypothetical protein